MLALQVLVAASATEDADLGELFLIARHLLFKLTPALAGSLAKTDTEARPSPAQVLRARGVRLHSHLLSCALTHSLFFSSTTPPNSSPPSSLTRPRPSSAIAITSPRPPVSSNTSVKASLPPSRCTNVTSSASSAVERKDLRSMRRRS